MSAKRYTIAVDFDGVLHPYTRGWVGVEPDDEPPVEGAHEALAELAEKYAIVVFSTRCDSPDGVLLVRNWLAHHGLLRFVDSVQCEKPGALAYIDDRAVPFDGDWTTALDATRSLVKHGPWGKRA